MSMQQKIVTPPKGGNQVVEHCVYIAHSPGLATLAEACCGRLALKIGYSGDVETRIVGLRGELPYDSKKCCGFDDWKLIAKYKLDNRDEALTVERIMLATFRDRVIDHEKITSSDGWKNSHENLTGHGNGHTEVRLMPEDFFEMNFDDFLKQNFQTYLDQTESILSEWQKKLK